MKPSLRFFTDAEPRSRFSFDSTAAVRASTVPDTRSESPLPLAVYTMFMASSVRKEWMSLKDGRSLQSLFQQLSMSSYRP